MKVLAREANCHRSLRGVFVRRLQPLLNPNQHHASRPVSIRVNASIEKVWTGIGKYCDIWEWAFQNRDLLSGNERETGAVKVSLWYLSVSNGSVGSFGRWASRPSMQKRSPLPVVA